MSWSERVCRRLLVAALLAAAPAAVPRAAADDALQRQRTEAERDAAALLGQLRAEGEALARRERLVREREQTGKAAQHETERRLAELESLRVAIDERLARLAAATDERVARLADLYGRMPADRAAVILATLDPDLAARIVGRMRRSRAGAVLAALPPARAAELSRRIVRPGGEALAPPLASAAPGRPGSGAASVP